MNTEKLKKVSSSYIILSSVLFVFFTGNNFTRAAPNDAYN